MAGEEHNTKKLLAIENFKEYLRIPSVHPDVDYDACLSFLQKMANGLGLPMKVYVVSPKKPVAVITWTGTQPELPSLLLNSHMDVVPVFRENWTYDPYGAETDEKGNIYARGAQDMKCVGIQYCEAIRRLIESGVKLKRTIHILFVPDEEIGGLLGMKLFVQTEEFRNLNVGCALDEGAPSPLDFFLVFDGEKSIWQFDVHCSGTSGHSSLLHDNTSGEKAGVVLQKFMEKRAEEKKLADNSKHYFVDVTTINLTSIKGGVHNSTALKRTMYTTIPPEVILGFDCRLHKGADFQRFETWVNDVCREAGDGVWVETKTKHHVTCFTQMDQSNPWWVAFKSAVDELEVKIQIMTCPGHTDISYVRELGISTFGFSPMNNTPIRIHENDEFINEKVFLKGIDIYCKLITTLANS